MRALFSRLITALDRIGGLSRQGVIGTSRWVRHHPIPSGPRHALWLLPASVMIGIGVACLTAADLGVAPYDVAISAIEVHTPLSFGQAVWALSCSLFAIAAVLGVRPTARSLSFMLLNGLTIDAARAVVVAPDETGLRVALAAVGTVILVCGVATVVYQAAAGGSFESIMKVAEKHGRNPLVVRSVLEISFLVGGAAAGGAFGPVTVVIALGMGPAIGAGIQAFEDHRVGREFRLGSGAT